MPSRSIPLEVCALGTEIPLASGRWALEIEGRRLCGGDLGVSPLPLVTIPFAVPFDLWVEAPGFETLRIEELAVNGRDAPSTLRLRLRPTAPSSE